MEKPSELVVQPIGNDHRNIRITRQGFFEVKDQKKVGQTLFTGNNIHLRIDKTQLSQQNCQFMIKASNEATSMSFRIKDKDDLEHLFKLTGNYVTIVGLNEILISFRKVGEGAFAQVYEAITSYQTRFALKCFQKSSFIQGSKTKDSFHNQLNMMKLLDSPYLLSYSYLFESDKAFYLKMQYFEKTLKERLSSKISVRQQKIFMKHILMGLCELKKKDVIHRDLKPDNVMIRRNAKGEEECVIIDFGLATLAHAKEYLFFRCGTPGFLAPEIANLVDKKEKQKCSSDMFSAGCIFYKILTGRYLFRGKDGKEVLRNNRKCIFPQKYLEGLSVNEIRLLLQMLQKNPSKRITPEYALKSPYFNQDIDDDDQIPDEQCHLNWFLQKMGEPQQYKNMDSVNSLRQDVEVQGSVTSNVYKKYGQYRNSGLKDSCLTFQFPGNGKDSDSLLLKSSKMSVQSRTPEKTIRQSRFSRIGQDLKNII